MVAAGGQGSGQFSSTGGGSLFSRLPLVLDMDGANPINLTLVATSFETGAATVSGLIEEKEIR